MKEHSFDALAKEIADGAIPRGRALKYFGAAILGSMLGGGMLGMPLAEAKKRHKKKHKKKHKCKPLPPDSPCQNSAQCCPNTTRRICDVPVNASNSDRTCCGGNGAMCGPKDENLDDTAPFCCTGFSCNNDVCQQVPEGP